jgi:EAL domain-containing protein (putative c-di-GMP-specific phosphodiesterase class I)
MKVVAEGIESEAVWKILQQLGCDQGQGYFMAKPMLPEEIFAWKEGWQSI